MTLTAWATMSCSSRAIRARSSATAMRAAASRSRSASGCALLRRLGLRRRARAGRSRRARRSRTGAGMKTKSPVAVVGVVVDDDRGAAERRRPARSAPGAASGSLPSRNAAAIPAATTPAVNTTSRPSTNESAAASSQTDAGAREAPAAPAEQRQHDERDRRHGEPGRRARRPQRVVPKRDLERALDRREHDQHVQAVAAREGPEPAHAAERSSTCPRARLRPRSWTRSASGQSPDAACGRRQRAAPPIASRHDRFPPPRGRLRTMAITAPSPAATKPRRHRRQRPTCRSTRSAGSWRCGRPRRCRWRFLAWVAAPLLADHLDGPSGLPKALLLA